MDPHRPLRCIDYAPASFAVAGEAVPAEHRGKFVLLEGPSEGLFITSPESLCKYHANILERFCAYDGGPAHSMNEDRDHCTILDSGWEVLGGGKYILDSEARILRLGGQSMAYGAADLDMLCGRLSVLDVFAGYHIVKVES